MACSRDSVARPSGVGQPSAVAVLQDAPSEGSADAGVDEYLANFHEDEHEEVRRSRANSH